MLFQYDNVNGSLNDLRFDVLFNSNSAILARFGRGEGEQGDSERLCAILTPFMTEKIRHRKSTKGPLYKQASS